MVKRDSPIIHRVSLAPSAVRAKRSIEIVEPVDFHPFIRIAHRMQGEIDIDERVIVDHAVALMLRGEGTFTTRTEQLRLRPHDLFYIPPFVPHAVHTNAATDHIAVHFDLTLRRGRAHPEKRRPYEERLAGGLGFVRHRSLVPRDEIERALSELVPLFAKDSEAGRLGAHARLLAVLARMLESTTGAEGESEQSRNAARIERVVALMGSRLAQPLSTKQLCQASGLAESQFRSVFRAQTGYSPTEYLRRLRVDAAKTLLANPVLSVKEVAALTGFSDPYHFSRVFRQVSGLSPARFRQQR